MGQRLFRLSLFEPQSLNSLGSIQIINVTEQQHSYFLLQPITQLPIHSLVHPRL